jgi:raffinose/stachyose/melibiose transport system substrate-binding protein
MINTTPTAISRRSLLAILGAAGAGAVFTGCAGPGSTADNQPTGLATGKAEGELSFAHWRAEDKSAFDKLIADFQGKFPDVKVTQDISPSNDYQTQALNRLKGGAVGDVFPTFRGAQFEQFVKAGVYTDLTGQDFVGSYTPSLLEAGKSGGKQYGLPYQVVLPMPVANSELLSSAGVDSPPQDWDGFLGMCDKIKSKGVVPLAWPGGEVGNAGQLLNTMVMNEAPSDDAFAQIEAGKMKVTDDWFIGILKKYAQLRPYFQGNAVGTAVEPTQQLFVSRKAAMLCTGSYHIAAVRALGAKFPLELVPPITTTTGTPKYEGSYNATFILGINSASDAQPAAVEWLRFLSDKTNASTYANATVQHVAVDGVDYTDPDLKALAPWLTKKTMLAARFQFNDLDIRNAVEGSCISVVGGTDPAAAAKKAQAVISQRI